MNSSKATLCGVGAIALWASLALLTVETGRIPPFQLLAMTFGIASLLGFGKMAVDRDFSPLKQPFIVYFHGFCGLFLYHLCFFLALRTLPPATALLINALWCLLIVLFSALLPGGKLRANHVIGAFIGLAALVILVGNIDIKSPLGLFYALSCAFIWSIYSVTAKLIQDVPTESVAGFCLVTAIAAILCHVTLEQGIYSLTLREIISVLLIAVGPMGLAFYLWDFAGKHGNLPFIGAISYAAPVFGTVLLVIFGHSPWSVKLIIAAGLIVLSAIIASKKA
jgi:drug/metabolite transporter (DMT)-like permease